MPACVSRRHFCRSIQSRFRYQSPSVGGSSLSVSERPAEQIEHLLRAAHDHAANLAPAVGSSGCRFVLVDQPAEKIAAAHA